jgi:hypothetical protein
MLAKYPPPKVNPARVVGTVNKVDHSLLCLLSER